MPSSSTQRQYKFSGNDSSDSTTEKATVSEPNIFHDQS